MGKAPLHRPFTDRDESAAFESFLSQHWPLWRDEKNIGSPQYHHLKAAFDAGWKLRSRRDRAQSRNRA